VPLRRKINADVRSEDAGIPYQEGLQDRSRLAGQHVSWSMYTVLARSFKVAMLKENVAIGRSWPAMPNYVRVTVGTKAEMEKFQTRSSSAWNKAPGVNGAASLHLRSSIYRRSCIAASLLKRTDGPGK